jgi:hypothetical protein
VDEVVIVPDSRRAEALRLADEILGDVELGRIPPTDVARKTSRLARLLDDALSGTSPPTLDTRCSSPASRTTPVGR